MSDYGNDEATVDVRRRAAVKTLGLAAVAALSSGSAIAAQGVDVPKGDVTVVVLIRAKPGKAAELIKVTQALVPKVRQEKGNFLCQFHQGSADPELFVFYEIFENEAALKAHGEMPYVKQWVFDVEALTEGPAEVKVLNALG